MGKCQARPKVLFWFYDTFDIVTLVFLAVNILLVIKDLLAFIYLKLNKLCPCKHTNNPTHQSSPHSHEPQIMLENI